MAKGKGVGQKQHGEEQQRVSWKTVVAKAKDQTGWRDCVAALCATWHEEA